MDIEEKYEIDECVKWLEDKKYTKIALQFSESDLPDSTQVVKLLKSKLSSDVQLYIVLTASCTVDYLAPLRLGDGVIQAIICFGSGSSSENLCLASNTSFDQLPVLFVFGRNQELILHQNLPDDCLILYDLKCMHLVRSIVSSQVLKEYQVARVVRTNDRWSFSSSILDLVIEKHQVEHSFGRFSLSKPLEKFSSVVWIGLCQDLFYQVNIPIDITTINPINGSQSIFKPRQILMKRLALIEKAKKASTVGIVFNNSIPDVDSIMKRFSKLCEKKHKKLFKLCLVQDVDGTKFGNFPLIDIFVIVSSCTCGSLANGSIECHAPLITLPEFEMSLGVKCKYGGLQWNIDQEEDEADEETTTEQWKSSRQVLEYKEWMGTSWYGLRVDPGCDPVEQAVEGSRGVASNYLHEPY